MSDNWRTSGRWLLGLELFETIRTGQGVFDLDAVLPAQVFRNSEWKFQATDSAHALGGFSPVLNKLCEVHSDEWLALLLVTAHSDDLVPGFRFVPPIAEPLLVSRVRYEPDGDRARAYDGIAKCWVFLGSSGRWGCWVDQDWEMAVVGTTEHIEFNVEEVPFRPIMDELGSMLEMSGGSISDSVKGEFFSNYA
jgi:hypothetical protein